MQPAFKSSGSPQSSKLSAGARLWAVLAGLQLMVLSAVIVHNIYLLIGSK